MSGAGRAIRGALRGVRRRARRDVVVAVAAAAAGVPAVMLLLSYGAGAWGLRGAGPLMVLAAGAVATVGVAVGLTIHWLGPITEAAVAVSAERSRGLPDGALRGIVELGRELPPGVSRALFGRAESEMAGRLEGAGVAELSGELGAGARRWRMRLLSLTGVLLVLVLGAGSASPGRAKSAWGPLLHPVAHLKGPVLPPVLVSPGDAEVERGGRLRIEVTAPLRSEAALHWRAVGDVPRKESLELTEGRAAALLGPIQSPLVYWVTTADGAATDSFRVQPVDPLLVEALVTDVVYPAHTGRPADHFEGDPPTLVVPEGTLLKVRGRATRPLLSLSLKRADGGERDAKVAGALFRLTWRVGPASSGHWRWEVRGEAGEAANGPSPLELKVTPDAPPVVRITAPAPEAVLPAGGRQAVAADASDDFGLSGAALVFRRVPARGRAGAEVRVPIKLAGGEGRALLRTVLDASGMTLVPGDVIEYRVEATDNSPRRQVGRSSTQTLRVPRLSELRQEAREEADRLLGAMESLSREMAALEKTTRDLSRQATGQGSPGRTGGPSGANTGRERLGFQESSEAAQVVHVQESLLAEAQALAAQVEALRRSVERAGLGDPELRRKLAELAAQYRRAMPPDMKADAERLRKGAADLDRAEVQASLQKLAERQAEMEKQLEQSVDLMRRAAVEQELNALAREADEIAAEQQVLAAAMAGDSAVTPPPERPPVPSSPDSMRAQSARQSGAGSQSTAAASSDSTGAGANSSAANPAGKQPDAASPPSDSAGARANAASASPDSAGARSGGARPDSAAADSTASARAGSRSGSNPSSDENQSERQEGLRKRTEGLTNSLKSLEQQLLRLGERNASGQTGSARQKTQDAQESMGQAGQQSRQQQGKQAAASGKQAAGAMSSAAQELDAARQQMIDARRNEAQQAVRQATQDALELAQRQEQLRQQMERAQQQGAGGAQLQGLASEQEAVRQGLEQLGQNLSEAGQRSAAQDRQVSQALARATLDVQRTLEGMEESKPLPTQEAGQAVESLNQLAMSLLQSGAQMQRSQGGQNAQETLEELSRIARDQGALNQQVNAVAGMELDRGARKQVLGQAAQAQQGIARRVGDLSGMVGGEESVLGQLSNLSTEAEGIARELEQGRLSADVTQRQEELFRHLLDAGRTLERDEYSDERLSRSAEAGPVSEPAAVDPALLDGRLRYPVPTPAQLSGLPPAYRRLILEYFDRLNRPGSKEEP